MSVNSMLEAGTISEVQVTATSLARLAKWLSVRLQTKWLWVRISLLVNILLWKFDTLSKIEMKMIRRKEFD